MNIFIATTVPLFGIKHILGLLMMIVLSAIILVPLIALDKKLKEDHKLLALKIIYFVMIGMEILKFIILLRKYGNIPVGEFPYQLCSTPLYLFPIVCFSKNERVRRILSPAAFIIGLFAGAITLFYPSNILGGEYSWFSFSEDLFPLRSFIYHALMIVFAIYMLISKTYKIKHMDVIYAMIVMFGLSMIAVVLNALIPTADFFLLSQGNGSPLAFIKETSNVLYTISMIALGIVVVGLFYLPFEIIFLSNKKKNKKTNSI